MPADLAAENASRELAKLKQEEGAIRDRIANDNARLTVIAAQKAPLESILATAKAAEAKAAQKAPADTETES